MMKYQEYISVAAFIEEKLGRADIAIVLGSGLGGYEEKLENAKSLRYEDIPGFPVSTVKGHSGKLVAGTLFGKKVLMMCGRFHAYEGYDLSLVTLPVRVFKLLGVSRLILTNAAGGVNKAFHPGTIMLINDYINFSGKNPLTGSNIEEFGPRFPDMSTAFSKSLREKAKETAKQENIKLEEGVYCWFNGPTYETPAEVKMASLLGADAVGMSTVPEVIVARHCGMEVLGISTITNLAAGIGEGEINHEEVMEVGRRVKNDFIRLMDGIVKAL